MALHHRAAVRRVHQRLVRRCDAVELLGDGLRVGATERGGGHDVRVTARRGLEVGTLDVAELDRRVDAQDRERADALLAERCCLGLVTHTGAARAQQRRRARSRRRRRVEGRRGGEARSGARRREQTAGAERHSCCGFVAKVFGGVKRIILE